MSLGLKIARLEKVGYFRAFVYGYLCIIMGIDFMQGAKQRRKTIQFSGQVDRNSIKISAAKSLKHIGPMGKYF